MMMMMINKKNNTEVSKNLVTLLLHIQLAISVAQKSLDREKRSKI